MKPQEFQNEVLACENPPKAFIELYSTFQQYQELAIETLREFHRVCEKFDIWYQLACGSLLGAIRDNGQIPWDYDIDVFIRFDQKDNLVECLKKELSENFYFYCPEINSKCRHGFIRLAPKGYRTEALHVDVFLLVGGDDNEQARLQERASMAQFSSLRYKKLVSIKDSLKYHNLKITARIILNKLLAHKYPLNEITTNFYNLATKHSIDTSKYCFSADVFANDFEFVFEEIKETVLIDTSNGTFRIPKNYDYVLKILYGDYTKYPSLDSSINEMLTNCKKLIKSAKK